MIDIHIENNCTEYEISGSEVERMTDMIIAIKDTLKTAFFCGDKFYGFLVTFYKKVFNNEELLQSLINDSTKTVSCEHVDFTPLDEILRQMQNGGEPND